MSGKFAIDVTRFATRLKNCFQRVNRKSQIQWQLQAPPQQCPPPLPPLATVPGEPALAAANVENFLDNLFEPQRGHPVPFQSDERTRTSLS